MLKQILDIIGMLMLSLILVVHSVNLILYYKLEKKEANKKKKGVVIANEK